jgi:hypothetical protein
MTYFFLSSKTEQLFTGIRYRYMMARSFSTVGTKVNGRDEDEEKSLERKD